MSNELKRCPFCGGKAYYRAGSEPICVDDMTVCPDMTMHFVMCEDCSAVVSDVSKIGAITLWNMRQDERCLTKQA